MGKTDRWASPLGDYLTTLKAANRASGTIKLHRHYLTQLREVHRDPWRVTNRDLCIFLASDAWGAEARKSARTVVRGFYRWGRTAGHLERDPALDLAPVHVPPGVPRPTPEPYVDRIVHEADHRLVFMAMLAAYAGLRAGEIAQVHERDWLGAEQLLVHGKGAKLRVVPIASQRLGWELERVQGWAFPNGRGSHITPGHVTKLLSHALPIGWTGHTLRHRFATQAHGERDIYAVSALLGHSSLDVTVRYVQQPLDALARAAALACPDPVTQYTRLYSTVPLAPANPRPHLGAMRTR